MTMTEMIFVHPGEITTTSEPFDVVDPFDHEADDGAHIVRGLD